MVTCLSVIEHGVHLETFLREMNYIIKPEGYLIVSFDYRGEKIDLNGKKLLGLDWMIFSREDLENFIQLALKYDFKSTGAFNYKEEEEVIRIDDYNIGYTFGIIILKKMK